MVKNDFSKGPMWKCITAQAAPLMLAQLVQLLYNIVDRIYLGHLGDQNSLALTGVGLVFPIVTLITAFSSLFGMVLRKVWTGFPFSIPKPCRFFKETQIKRRKQKNRARCSANPVF